MPRKYTYRVSNFIPISGQLDLYGKWTGSDIFLHKWSGMVIAMLEFLNDDRTPQIAPELMPPKKIGQNHAPPPQKKWERSCPQKIWEWGNASSKKIYLFTSRQLNLWSETSHMSGAGKAATALEQVDAW